MEKTRFLSKFFCFLFCISLLMTFIGCEQNEPLSTDPDNAKSSAQIQFLSIADLTNSLKKETTVYEWIDAERGGIINLEHNGDEGLFIKNKFIIWPYTMSESAEIGISIDDETFEGCVDVQFSPHGIVFSQPASLNIYASGLDFDGVNTDELGIYYDNEDTGEWEEMECDEFNVYPDEGKLAVKNAKIPHFSRYGIGTE